MVVVIYPCFRTTRVCVSVVAVLVWLWPHQFWPPWPCITLISKSGGHLFRRHLMAVAFAAVDQLSGPERPSEHWDWHWFKMSCRSESDTEAQATAKVHMPKAANSVSIWDESCHEKTRFDSGHEGTSHEGSQKACNQTEAKGCKEGLFNLVGFPCVSRNPCYRRSVPWRTCSWRSRTCLSWRIMRRQLFNHLVLFFNFSFCWQVPMPPHGSIWNGKINHYHVPSQRVPPAKIKLAGASNHNDSVEGPNKTRWPWNLRFIVYFIYHCQWSAKVSESTVAGKKKNGAQIWVGTPVIKTWGCLRPGPISMQCV